MTNVTVKAVEGTGCCGGVTGALDKARTALAGARDTILHATPVEKARAGARAMNDRVHETPWSFIGGAAVLALAVGLLLRRR